MESAERPRQDPVSCVSCRKRKQRCNREEPCSNCSARGVPCVYSGRRAPTAAISHTVAATEIDNLRAENAAVKARLDRLEDVVFRGRAQVDVYDGERPSKVRRLAQTDIAVPTPSTTVSNSDPELARNYRSDVEWLDAIGTSENTRLPQLSTDFEIFVEPLAQIIQSIAKGQQERCIMLPQHTEATQLFNAYLEQVDPMQHVIHVPSTRQSAAELYIRIKRGERVEPNETVLLLSIFATISSYWHPPETVIGFSDSQSASNAAHYWLKATLDVLEHVKRTTSATLGTVQACLLLIFLIYHLEGFSPKVRGIIAEAICFAKDLGLHKTDSHKSGFQQTLAMSVVEKEMRRRVWWHLTGTDWSLTLAGGPHEGCYSINPKHMKVNIPRNVSDEELETESLDFEHSHDEPTVMAYFLQRIRLSEISREIADLTCSIDADEITLEDVLRVENRFQILLADLPIFLRADAESRQKVHDIDILHRHIVLETRVDLCRNAPVLQRYTVNFTLHTRRCKFHLPYLLRGSHEPDYAFSRKACLESARAVLNLKTDLTVKENLWMSNSNLGGFLHLHFYATVVLVMDLCINKANGDEAARKEEIQEAVRTLEHADQHSVAARLFLNSLRAALQKHKIGLQGQQSGNEAVGMQMPGLQTGESAAGGRYVLDQSSSSWDAQPFHDLEFDELWQSYIDSGMTFDPSNWDSLFTDLEACVQGFGED